MILRFYYAISSRAKTHRLDDMNIHSSYGLKLTRQFRINRQRADQFILALIKPPHFFAETV